MEKSQATEVVRVRGVEAVAARDWLAVERPLEIRARTDGAVRVVSTTMRTPGEDLALVAGFLFAEGVVKQASDLRALESVDEDTVLVELGSEADAALNATKRSFVTSGACGVCGRASLDGLMSAAAPATRGETRRIPATVIHALPAALRQAQTTFAQTGGLHAAGLFTTDGGCLAVHEDVGRHNAVDKLVGTLLLAGQLPAHDRILVVSGRSSFELVQKAIAAGVPLMVAVGAPSSLAVEMARTAGMTLLGFVRDGGFNVYAGAERLNGI
ncbi:MAG TPA: formate dehydrogenase accessory sulfurtransferase FdhD [Polyangia bacterium]|jgi:FdhD protein